MTGLLRFSLLDKSCALPAMMCSRQDKDSLEGSLQLLVAGEMLTVSQLERAPLP